jgi:Putative addiction module component
MSTLEQVRKEALALSQEDREFLSVELALSIAKEPGYDAALDAEIRRRRAAIASGEMALIDSEEAEALMFGDDE